MTRRSKEAKPHHLIEQVEVTGGLLANLKVRFVDGLNCAFGERGTFKTTLLELIRFALAQDSKSSRGLIQANLGNGRVRLTVRTKHGVRYVIERAWGEGPQVFTESGEPIAVSLERDAIFKA
ncbi:MAG TPA: hypothetical protein VMV18_00690, partial [bacterium]|nr:hypothetical protein [bacterium]